MLDINKYILVKIKHKMNETSQEDYFGIGQVAETLGLFLYLVDPAKSSFETIEECPDYVSQVSR